VRAVGFAASIRTSSTRGEANPWTSEEALSPSSSSCREREGGTDGTGVFVFSGTRRTYNKLESHHPRDLAAITRPSSPGGGEGPASVRRSFLATPTTAATTTTTTAIMMERTRARARAPVVSDESCRRPWGGSKMGKDLTADQRPSAF